MRGEVDNAFCAVRPPGHHASAAQAMGFCFLTILLSRVMLKRLGRSRVAIVDFDVHHGNGAEAVFSNDEAVLRMVGTFAASVLSLQRHRTSRCQPMQCSLGCGYAGEGFRQAATDRWLPRLHDFQPGDHFSLGRF